MSSCTSCPFAELVLYVTWAMLVTEATNKMSCLTLGFLKTCKPLRALIQLPLVWNLAYDASPLPLPPRSEDASAIGYRTELISATKLEENWRSPCPTIKGAQALHSPASAIWLLQDSTCIMMAHSSIISCVKTETQTTIIGSIHLLARPTEFHVCQILFERIRRPIIAYSIPSVRHRSIPLTGN